MLFNPPLGPGYPSRLTCLLLGAVALTACAHRPPPPLTIVVPDLLRAPCERPDTAGVRTVGDLSAFSLRQEAALAVCDGRRAAAVALVDAHNRVVAPKRRWWRFDS